MLVPISVLQGLPWNLSWLKYFVSILMQVNEHALKSYALFKIDNKWNEIQIRIDSTKIVLKPDYK
jgi:hypothetical protein